MPEMKTSSVRRSADWRPISEMSLAKPMTLKIKNTPTKKVIEDVRGTVFQKGLLEAIGLRIQTRKLLLDESINPPKIIGRATPFSQINSVQRPGKRVHRRINQLVTASARWPSPQPHAAPGSASETPDYPDRWPKLSFRSPKPAARFHSGVVLQPVYRGTPSCPVASAPHAATAARPRLDCGISDFPRCNKARPDCFPRRDHPASLPARASAARCLLHSLFSPSSTSPYCCRPSTILEKAATSGDTRLRPHRICASGIGNCRNRCANPDYPAAPESKTGTAPSLREISCLESATAPARPHPVRAPQPMPHHLDFWRNPPPAICAAR